MDSWEEGFDTWTPRTGRRDSGAVGGEDTDMDLERAELLRLARELAERRRTGRTGDDTEVEQLKQTLRERAEAVAARERELAALQRRLERDRPRIRRLRELRPSRDEPAEPAGGESIEARERATHERSLALDERERALQAQTAEVEAEAAELATRERELATELTAAAATLAETEAERARAAAERELATAERDRLEERDRAVHDREKVVAATRMQVEAERQELVGRAADVEARAAELERRAGELAARAAALDNAVEHGVQQVGSVEREAAAKLAAVEEQEQMLARRESTVASLEARERALADREAKLDAEERDLALVREGLGAERHALLERERRLRQSEAGDARETFARPFAPPSFSDGLAALARSRSRD
jgi:hypothetical protein